MSIIVNYSKYIDRKINIYNTSQNSGWHQDCKWMSCCQNLNFLWKLSLTSHENARTGSHVHIICYSLPFWYYLSRKRQIIKKIKDDNIAARSESHWLNRFKFILFLCNILIPNYTQLLLLVSECFLIYVCYKFWLI